MIDTIKEEFKSYLDELITAENNFSMDGALDSNQPRYLPSTNPLYTVDTTLYEAPEKENA